MAFYTCPYCDGTEETPVSSAFHVCDQNKVKDKIKALEDKTAELMEAARQEATAKIHEAVASYDAVCKQNAELLAALKAGYDDLRTRLIQHAQSAFGTSYDSAAKHTDSAFPVLEQMRAAIARATGESEKPDAE